MLLRVEPTARRPEGKPAAASATGLDSAYSLPSTFDSDEILSPGQPALQLAGFPMEKVSSRLARHTSSRPGPAFRRQVRFLFEKLGRKVRLTARCSHQTCPAQYPGAPLESLSDESSGASWRVLLGGTPGKPAKRRRARSEKAMEDVDRWGRSRPLCLGQEVRGTAIPTTKASVAHCAAEDGWETAYSQREEGRGDRTMFDLPVWKQGWITAR